jgi:DNA-binding CsgD family transcriptional regulator
VLLGRDAELQAVDALLDGVVGGRAAALAIEGDPGIGKSALLDEVAQTAARRGAAVVAARCDELGQGVPFGPFIDAGGPFADDVRARSRAAWDAPTASQSSLLETGPEVRSLLVTAVAEAAEHACLQGPLVICLDDLHWADSATLLALVAVLRRCGDLPLGIVLACRPHPRSRELAAFVEAIDAPVLVLGPLDAEDVARLVARYAGAPPAADLEAATARCGGNPLLLVETVTQLAEDGAIAVIDGRATASPDAAGPVTVTLRDTVRSRMARVDGEMRAVAAVGALMGSRFTASDLAAVTGRPLADLVPLVQELIDARLLVDDGASLSYRHDLVREAVATALPTSVRAELHQAIADGLRSSGAASPRVAEHVSLAAPYGSADAIGIMRAAASEVSPQDPSAAHRLLSRALELCPPEDPVHDELLAELVDALAWSGRPGEVKATVGAALERPLPAATEERLRSALGRSLLLLGHPQDAIPHEERVIAIRETGGLPVGWAEAECAMCRLFGADLDGAVAQAAAAVEAGDAEGDAMAQILGLCVQVFARNTYGDSATAVDLAVDAIARADATPRGVGHRLHPHLFHGIALQTLGTHDAAAQSFRQGRTLGEALGASWALPLYHFVTALAHWDAAEWDDLLAEVDAGVGLADEEGSTIGQVWAFAVAGRVHLHRGDVDLARTALDRGDAVVAAGGLQYGVDWLLLSRALLLEATGDVGDACALLRAGWEVAAGLQAVAAITTFGPDLVRIAVAAGDHALAGDVTASLAGAAAAHPSDRVVAGRAARAHGLLRRDGDALVSAAVVFRELGHPFEAALVDGDAGAAFATANRAADAVDALERALAVFDDVGAVRDAAAARDALDRIAPRRDTAPSRARAVEGWDALTPTELHVVEEVCSGRSNGEVAARLGVSRRTVEAHLRSIYTKLQVPTRLALAVAYSRR